MLREERTQERGFKERVLKEMEECLDHHPLYEYESSDLKGYRLGRKESMKIGGSMFDPRFYIDHLYVDREGKLTQHPYGIDMERLEGLIEWCRETGHRFHISGHSCYFPNATMAIIFEKAKDCPVKIDFSVHKSSLLDGTKTMTIRRYRVDRFQELLLARNLEIRWKRGTKEAEKLFDAEILSVTAFRFPSMSEEELQDLALEDGFNGPLEMRTWFDFHYGEDAWEDYFFMAIRFRRRAP